MGNLDFDRALSATKTLSPHTARQYRRFITAFKVFSKHVNNTSEITSESIKDWIIENKWSAQTRAQCMSALRWCFKKMDVELLALSEIRTVGFKPVDYTYFLSRSDLNQIIDMDLAFFQKNNYLAIRNKAICIFVIETLATVEDVHAAMLEDIGGGEVVLRLRGPQAVPIHLSEPAQDFFRGYVEELPIKNDKAALFQSKPHWGAITQSGVHRAVVPVIRSFVPRDKCARSGCSITMLRKSAELGKK